jgi:endoglucanase
MGFAAASTVDVRQACHQGQHQGQRRAAAPRGLGHSCCCMSSHSRPPECPSRDPSADEPPPSEHHARHASSPTTTDRAVGPLTYVGPGSSCPPPSATLNATADPAAPPKCAAPDAYACALNQSLHFFDTQRSGPLAGGPAAALPWRGDSGLSDAAPNGTPLVGGWYDGGDTSKFVFPGCWALANLAWALTSFPEAFDQQSGLAGRVQDDLKFEGDFIVAARYEPGAMLAYTSAPGNLTTSHNWWGRPEDVTVPATVGSVRAGQPAADLLGACAAALAAVAAALRPAGDAATADKYVEVAKSMYAQATEPASLGLYTDANGAVPELRGYYKSSSYEDDLAWAAAWLAVATGDGEYLQEARKWYASMPNVLQRNALYSWDQVGQGAGLLIASQLPRTDGVWKQYTLATRVNM